MIDALDSERAPDATQAAAARAAGVLAWGGYLVSDDDQAVLAARAAGEGLRGLAGPWTRAEFAVVQAAGLRAIAFCSGWDDPAALRLKAAAWRLLGLLDDEDGIRPEGPWADGWLATSGFGLYGLLAVQDAHVAPYRIAALYPAGGCPGRTWPVDPAPAVPHGWQCQGTHEEFGLGVDRSVLADWFKGGLSVDRVDCARPDGGRDWYTVVNGQVHHVVTGFDGQITFADALPGSWSAAITCGYRGTMPYFQGLGTDAGVTPFEVVDPGPGWVLAAKP